MSWRDALAGARQGYGGWRSRLRGRRVAEPAWRLVVLASGLVVIAVGVVLLVIPGPGWLIIFLGLGILAAEFAWAQRLLTAVRGYYERVVATARRRRAKRSARVE